MIKCIIFDWGGIFTTNDYPRISNSFGVPIKIISDLEYKYSAQNDCRGFWRELRELGVNKTRKQMDRVFNYQLDVGCLKYLPKFKDYHLVLLSDQVTDRTNYLRKKYKRYLDRFDKVFFSNEIGLIKKNKNAFEFVLKQIPYKPSECIFIDDTLLNIKNAKSVGLNAIQFKSVSQLKKDLKKFSISI
ncbi:HAD-IA family hydrolase [Candidatus Woesearchaeota archaeon]|jgi:HAD superfamily hydrolase (TIGR01509 family)|nr:HAD-IA family hydrolase [Candidatus Woesearchaeota archaeon]MBT4114548.1 HAD-IA family hydrolase [Candidatus Woesearchaeota archaeon]MBT4248674.1 HAD-IA family hydrolase [Candidatus Woesearchaeota archaeon]